MAGVNYDFSDETVIVTGGSSGIGRQTAIQFADAGATVVNADVRETPKDVDATVPTHERILERGGEATFVETDVGDAGQVASVVEGAREFGGVDVMVNNAAVFPEKPFAEFTPERIDRLLSINVQGAFFGCQAAALDMIDRDDPGVLLNTASISSNVAQGSSTPYEVTKGAIRMLTRGMAFELAEHGIRVNAVAPGQIATEIVEGWTEEAKKSGDGDGLLKAIPLGREGRPADVAPAFCWLASDDASYVTGELLFVDGGWQIC